MPTRLSHKPFHSERSAQFHRIGELPNTFFFTSIPEGRISKASAGRTGTGEERKKIRRFVHPASTAAIRAPGKFAAALE